MEKLSARTQRAVDSVASGLYLDAMNVALKPGRSFRVPLEARDAASPAIVEATSLDGSRRIA
jgi:hypothetical protein